MPPKISFDTLIGQSQAKAILQSALASGRIAHAYLFHGEAHTGKFTTALAFAKAGLCQEPKNSEQPAGYSLASSRTSCNVCSSCRAVDTSSHPDLAIFQPDGTFIKIKQIRELQKAITFKPLIGSRKWFILDEADALNPEAANCFLKTLEEPPGFSTLILITAKPQALLPTLRSRCQGIRFGLPPEKVVVEWLQNRLGLNTEDAHLLYVLTGGKMGMALETDLATLKSDRSRLLLALSRENLEDLTRLFDAPDELGGRSRLLENIDAIEIWLRDVLISHYTPDASLLIHQDIEEEVRHWGRAISPIKLLETLTLIQHLRRAMTRNLNHTLVLETLLLKIRDAIVPLREPSDQKSTKCLAH